MPSAPSNQPDDELPEAFIAELRATYGRNVPAVPDSLDALILGDARAGFARRRRFRLAVRTGLSLAAVAAVVALALASPFMRVIDSARRDAARAPVPTQLLSAEPAAAEDVDGSGKVDILDAFVVARLIEAREQMDAAYDVNGDGTVDRADVDRIALVAVDTSGATNDERVQ